MGDDRLALFPLGMVLMPGIPLPLRVFEPRYKRLLDDIRTASGFGRFGVVALTAGLEVDAGLDDSIPQFSQVGTVAEVLEVHPQADGTVSVLTGGSQRFRIVRTIETTAPYLSADVTYLDEVEGDMPATLPNAARALAMEYSRLIAELTGTDPDSGESHPDDLILLSYRLATQAPLAPDDRQRLLEDDTATARLLHVQRVLRREVTLLRSTRSVAVAPSTLQSVLRLN
jgi:hypothetical protein